MPAQVGEPVKRGRRAALLSGLLRHPNGIADLGPRRAALLSLADVMVDELVTEIGQGLRTEVRLADARQGIGVRRVLRRGGRSSLRG
ncbi:MAG: hypothetical protein WKF73_19825 [Nocardioidaceae bacterium]